MKRMWSEEEIASQKKDISTLEDSKGNPRFIEGEGTLSEIAGVTFTYNKWSLSGTHLMFVLAGIVADTTNLAGTFATYNLPQWLLDKIRPTFSNIIEIKVCDFRASDFTQQVFNISLIKDNEISISKATASTLTADRAFRIQFDLLIDSE